MEIYQVTQSPELKKWLDDNAQLFKWLRSGHVTPQPVSGYWVFVNFDDYVRSLGGDMQEWFNEIAAFVGELGKMRLELAHTEMDDAWHIILVQTTR
jgi:hypothetical protein